MKIDLKVKSTASDTEPVAGTFTEVGEVARTGIVFWTLSRQGGRLWLALLAHVELEMEEEKYKFGHCSAEHSSCAEQFQLLELCSLLPV